MTGTRWRAWLAAISIFVLGLAVGAAGTVWLGTRVIRRAFQAPAASTTAAERAAARIGAELADELALTPAQAARVQAILNDSAANLRAVRMRALAEARAELRDSTARIAAELPPEKHAEFYRIIARRFHRLGMEPPTAAEQR